MKSKIDRIKELSELLTSGVISEEEFNSLKAEVLGSIKDSTESSKVKDETDSKKASIEPARKSNPAASKPSSPIEPARKTKEKQKSALFQDTDQFWETFHASLESPISYWRDYKSCTVSDWIDNCSNNQFSDHLDIIFDSTPLLKDEYPVVWSGGTGMILTNYRLFVNMDAGLFIIPLCSLTSYKVLRDEKVRIKYNANGESQYIDVYAWLLPEYVDSAKNAKQWTILSDAEREYLQYGFYDLKSRFNLNPPKVSYNYSRYDGNAKNKSKKGKRSRSRTNAADDTSIGSKNVFAQITYYIKNHPHFLLILLYPWLAYWTFIGTCCCVNMAEGYKIRDEGFAYFTDTDNWFFILAVLLPFLIGLITAIRMIFYMIIGKHYPNGDHPWGFLPIISIAGYALVSWFFINSLFLIPTGDDISNNVQNTEGNSIEDVKLDTKEKAKKYAVGTWVMKTGSNGNPWHAHKKFVVYENGTCDQYSCFYRSETIDWEYEVRLNWIIEKQKTPVGESAYFILFSEDNDFDNSNNYYRKLGTIEEDFWSIGLKDNAIWHNSSLYFGRDRIALIQKEGDEFNPW